MSVLKVSLAYREVNNLSAVMQLVCTLAAYFLFLSLAIVWVAHLWVAIPFAVCAGIAGIRLYMLQHDCMHRCFIRPKWLNDAIGIVLSVFTLSPFYACRFNHGQHHSHVGDLDHRESFEINVLTVDEYRALSPLRQLVYRVYRSPFTLFIVGPFVVFAILNRFPKNTLKHGFVGDVLLHNAMLAGFVGMIYALAGMGGVWMLVLTIYSGASLSVIIPYVEHNFEDVLWGRKPDLEREDAALKGSAVLDFGRLFHLLTANIGFHDLHHLNPNIPSYNLKRCYDALEADGLLASRKVGWREAFSCFRWKLWDEQQGKMVTFTAV